MAHISHNERALMTQEERFWAKVYKTDDCWFWLGMRDRKGYGRFWVGERRISVPRFALSALGKEVPQGFDVHHLCSNRSCVNPEHLVVMSASEHARHHNHKWAERRVIAAIRLYHIVYGRPPRASDWNLQHSFSMGHSQYELKLERWNAREWPTANTVQRVFGSWANAIEQAGLPRPRIGAYDHGAVAG